MRFISSFSTQMLIFYLNLSYPGNAIATHEIINNYPNITKNPNGNTMVVRSDMDLNLYDLTTGKMITKLDGPTEKIYYNISYSADGRKIIASDALAQTVFIWGGETGKQLKQFNIPAVSYATALNSNATKMLTSNFDNNDISIWDVATQTVINTLSEQNQIYSVKFSPDNSMIAATMQNNDTSVWNAVTEEQLISIPGDDITFSSNSKRLQTHTAPAENEEKCTVILWDIATKKQIKTFIAEHDLFDSTSDLLNVVSPDDINDHNFILWTPFTSEERSAFEKMKDLTIQQAQSIYQLYTNKIKNLPIKTDQEFASLPQDIKNIITQYILNETMISQTTAPQPKKPRLMLPLDQY